MRNLFENTVDRLFSEKLSPEIISGSEGGEWLGDLWQSIEELGFCGAAAPEELGGLSASWGDIYAIVRSAGYYNAPLPLTETIFVNWILGRLGAEALTGPAAFSASSDMVLKDGKVSGTISDVPWGRHVDHCLSFTESAGEFYCVVLKVKEATNICHYYNVAREPRDSLTFQEATPVIMMLLPTGMSKDTLHLGGAMLRAVQVGAGLQRALDLCVTYAGERVQFGRAIMKFQAVQQQIAVLAEQTAMVQIAAEAVFCEFEDHLPVTQIMAAKVCAGEAVKTAVPIAHAVHGAIGFTYEYSLHLTTRRLLSWSSEFGSATHWAKMIGRNVCEKGGSHLWTSLVAGRF